MIGRIGAALRQAREWTGGRDDAVAEGERGFYLEFNLPAAEQAVAEKLENKTKKIELVAVKSAEEIDSLSATVFVPERAEQFFLERVEAYRDEETISGKPKHEAFVTRLEDVRLGVVRSLFTDDLALYPEPGRQVWWEVWVRSGRLQNFRLVTERLNIPINEHTIRFPEREVALALADETGLETLLRNSDAVAELRLAKDTPALFLEMGAVEQAEWVDDLVERITLPPPDAPAICLLDSGATRAHPLVSPGLAIADQYAYDPGWGVGDSAFWNGHGTAMSGVALYADLEAALTGGDQVNLSHRLETVKILPPGAQNDPELYGAITRHAVETVEEGAPQRTRIVCMAVTSPVFRPSCGLDRLSQFSGQCQIGADFLRL